MTNDIIKLHYTQALLANTKPHDERGKARLFVSDVTSLYCRLADF